MKPLLVLTTYPSKKEAEDAAKEIVKKKLGACASICPINSVYSWKGKIEDSEEFSCMIKTVESKLNALENFIKEKHPYEIPEFLVMPVTGSKGYLDWMKSCID